MGTTLRRVPPYTMVGIPRVYNSGVYAGCGIPRVYRVWCIYRVVYPGCGRGVHTSGSGIPRVVGCISPYMPPYIHQGGYPFSQCTSLYHPGYTTTLPWSVPYYTTGTCSTAVSGREALGSDLRLISVKGGKEALRTLKV